MNAGNGAKGAEPAAMPTLQVVFLLDITGSMATQIEGVKSMVSEFCYRQQEALNIHIWTYTETPYRCYVSKSPLMQEPSELVRYVNAINVCCPPDYPSETKANGGDGPENVVAAVVSLLDSFNSTENILCFIITDAPPHHKAFEPSLEAVAEKRWLREHDHTEQDVFVLLNQVIDELNVTFVPILYNNKFKSHWYQQAAVLTQGLILCPKQATSEVLAIGLKSLLESFQIISTTRRVDEVNNLDDLWQGFSVVSINSETFEFVEVDFDQELDCYKDATINRNQRDVKAAILGLLETTCDRFRGKKSTKRCRSVNPEIISSSVRVLTMFMLQLVGSEHFDEAKLNDYVFVLIQALTDSKSDTRESEIRLLQKWINKLPTYKKELEIEIKSIQRELQPVQCVLSLESAFETLNGLEQLPRTEEDVNAWMEIVQQLTMCRLLSVSFPLDATGCEDFMDAWSASIRQIETSCVMTVYAAARLRDPETCVFTDPISGRYHNAAIILAHPEDLILTSIYSGLSALPTLQGLVQSYLVSGGLKIFPSIVPGLQASSLLSQLMEMKETGKCSQSTWEVMRCLVWSLQQSLYTPASKVLRFFKNGNGLNPADQVSKLLAATITYCLQDPGWETTKILQLLFEELTGASIGIVYRKLLLDKSSESEIGQSESKLEEKLGLNQTQISTCFVRTNNIIGFDPTISLHSIETINADLNISDGLKKLACLVSTTEEFKNSVRIFNFFYNLLKCDLKAKEFTLKFPSIPSFSEEAMANIYAESLLLRKRASRYNLGVDKDTWTRVSAEELSTILMQCCIDNIRSRYQSNLVEWNATRKKFARENLMSLLRTIAGSIDVCNQALSVLYFEVVGHKYTLGRMDVIDALAQITTNESLNTLGVALCIGSWTPQPPANLRRHCIEICQRFEHDSELAEMVKTNILKTSICTRPPETPNRQGHHRLNTFPGICGWTENYHSTRLASVRPKHRKKVNKKLKKMKVYSEFVNMFREDVVPTLGKNRTLLVDWIFSYNESLEKQSTVVELAGRIVEKVKLDDGNSWDAVVNNWISKMSRVSKRRGRKPLCRLNKFLNTVI